MAFVNWENGVSMVSYINGAKSYGYFEFQNLKDGLAFEIVPPKYQNDMKSTGDNSVAGSGLEKLGYPTGTIIKTNKSTPTTNPVMERAGIK
jgi:hypothetical protein